MRTNRGIEPRPGGTIRRFDRRRREALLDAGDEIELPGATLDLPGAERDEGGEQQQCDQAEPEQGRRRTRRGAFDARFGLRRIPHHPQPSWRGAEGDEAIQLRRLIVPHGWIASSLRFSQ